MNKKNCALKLVDEIILHYDARSKKHQITFHLGYKNQSVYYVSGTSRCFFSDKSKTRKYSVGRA